MAENEISVIWKEGGSHILTFNMDVSRMIEEGGYKWLNMKQDDVTGEIGLEICHDKGVRMTMTGRKDRCNFKFTNKGWVGRLCDVLGLEKDGTRHILTITKNLSAIDRCMFFRIVKKD